MGNWALAWEGHAGLHFFTRFPKGMTNPFILSLPEGFVINRHWWGQDGSHWATTHDLRFDGSNFNKKFVLVGDGFKRDCFMWWDGNKEKGTWIVKSWPQYAVAVPKGDSHIWYRAAFQFELNNGFTTADIGKWTSTSGNPLPRCPLHTLSSSGPRLGILSLITGTFTKEKKLNSPLTTKPHEQI